MLRLRLETLSARLKRVSVAKHSMNDQEAIISLIKEKLLENGFARARTQKPYNNSAYLEWFVIDKGLVPHNGGWRGVTIYTDRVNVHREHCICDEDFFFADPEFPNNFIDHLNRTWGGV